MQLTLLSSITIFTAVVSGYICGDGRGCDDGFTKECDNLWYNQDFCNDYSRYKYCGYLNEITGDYRGTWSKKWLYGQGLDKCCIGQGKFQGCHFAGDRPKE